MKVIDLLNKIANGEEVPIEVLDKRAEIPFEVSELMLYDLLSQNDIFLNDEIEIIEDEKIQNIPYCFSLKFIDVNDKELVVDELDKIINYIYDKINEIIDHINKENKE